MNGYMSTKCLPEGIYGVPANSMDFFLCVF